MQNGTAASGSHVSYNQGFFNQFSKFSLFLIYTYSIYFFHPMYSYFSSQKVCYQIPLPSLCALGAAPGLYSL